MHRSAMFSALVKEVSSAVGSSQRSDPSLAKALRISDHGCPALMGWAQGTGVCKRRSLETDVKHDLVAALITSQQLGLPAQDLYRSSQSAPSMSWGGAQEAPPLAEELWVGGACWRWGNHFLEGRHHCRVPILQRIAQRPCSCGPH